MANEAAHPESIADIEWLRAHLDDPTIAFVHVGDDRAQYESGHLPGSVWAHGYDDLTVEREGIRALVPQQHELEATLGRLGIDESKTVVFLATGKSMWPHRGFWVLRYYRFPDVKIADRSLAALAAQGFATTTEEPKINPAECHLEGPDPSVMATWEEVLAAATRDATSGDARILDCRTSGEYAGQPGGHPAPRDGRIPRAHHLNWELLVDDDGQFLDVERLRTLYAAAGIDGTRPVFPYCGGGIRSAASWFAMHEVLGWDLARNYDGSWAEWSRRTDLPIETDA